MSNVRVAVVVPPAALSMAGGPPSASITVASTLEESAVPTVVIDTNARFFRLLLGETTRERVVADIDRRLKHLLGLSVLTQDLLTKLGRLLAFRDAECLRSDVVERTAMSWAAIDEILSGEGGDRETRALGEDLYAGALDRLAEDVLRAEPSAIAFTVLFHEQAKGLISLGRRIREAGFDGPMIAGGALFKLSDEQETTAILLASGVDLAWRSDLFCTPPELRAFLTGAISDPDSVRGGGVVTRSGKVSTAFDPPPRQLPRQFEWPTLNLDDYLRPLVFPVLVSVGCYWGKCDFCDYPFLANRTPGSSTNRFRKADAVVEEIRDVTSRYPVRRIDLISDAIPYGWFPHLETAAGKSFVKAGVEMECSVRAERTARTEHFEAMAHAGVAAITLGVEALDDEVLKGMSKGNTTADVMRCARLASEFGIKVKANLIVDHPRIQPKHVPGMINALTDLAPMLDALGAHRFSLSPHAPISAELDSVGLVKLPGHTTTDHGEYALAFERKTRSHEREAALAVLSEEVETLAYELEVRACRASNRSRVVSLPYRWCDDNAVRDEANADLHVEVPSKSAPFQFFVGERLGSA